MARLTVGSKKFICTIILLSFAALPGLLTLNLRTAGVFLLCVYSACAVMWLAVTHNPLSLFLMFFTYCMLCNAGQVILYTVGIDFDNFVNIYVDYYPGTLRKALIFQAQCVIYLTCGAILSYKPYTAKRILKNIGSSRLRGFDFIYILFLAIMISTYACKLICRTKMSYGEFFYCKKSGGTGADARLRLMFYATMYLSCFHHRQDRFYAFIVVSGFVLGVMMLLVGTRSLIIPLISGPLFIRGVMCVKMRFQKLPLAVLCPIALLMILRVVKIVRLYSFDELSADIVASSVSEGAAENLKNILAEMGSSADCLAETVKQFDRTDCAHSTTVTYSILKTFLPVNVLEFLGVEPPGSLSRWVTSAGGGREASWGCSVFAEMYANFGEYGYLSMLPFGYFWVKLERRAVVLMRRKPFLAMAVVYLLSYCIFLARAEAMLAVTLARYCIYVAVLSSVKIKLRWSRV